MKAAVSKKAATPHAVPSPQDLSASNLKNALWATLADLRSGQITPHTANSIAHQSREIMRIIRTEIQVADLSGTRPSKKTLTFTGVELKDPIVDGD